MLRTRVSRSSSEREDARDEAFHGCDASGAATATAGRVAGIHGTTERRSRWFAGFVLGVRLRGAETQEHPCANATCFHDPVTCQ
jgi:hypothetical protein